MVKLVPRTANTIMWLSLLALFLVGLTDVKVVWGDFGGPYPMDAAYGVSADSSGVYVAGYSAMMLPGQTNKGGDDAFVCKYDVYGNVKWTRQFGSPKYDVAYGVSVYSLGVYVAGSTYGTLPGQTQTNKGLHDAFVRKYDVYGNVKWTRQFGSSDDEWACGVSADSSGVYVAGTTWGALPGQTNKGYDDAFVLKYDAYGNLKWIRQFGTSTNDEAHSVSVYSSGVYVAGTTFGVFPGQSSSGQTDAFVRKYDSYGNVKWTRQFGSPASGAVAYGVSVYSSGVYVAGDTQGTLPGQTQTNKGWADAFVRKYDVYGNVKWTRQFGTSGYDEACGVSASSSGVYVTGYTTGVLPGKTSQGATDAFVRKYNVYGTLIWTRQFGTSGNEEAYGVSVYSTGVYVAGMTDGGFPGQTNGFDDAFVCKHDAYGNLKWVRQFGS